MQISENIKATINRTYIDDSKYACNYMIDVTFQIPGVISEPIYGVKFSKGKGKRGLAYPPSAWEVCQALQLDVSCVIDNPPFVYWCDEFGFDADDSIKALNAYHACFEMLTKLKIALGLHFDEFMLIDFDDAGDD